jgi:hypothetical protein
MINSSSPIDFSIKTEIGIEQTNESACWLDRGIKWLRADDEEDSLFVIVKNILAIALTILLFATVIGIPFVCYGYRVWLELRPDQDLTPPNIKNLSEVPKYNLKDSISQSLLNFNNSKVKGEVNGIYITTNETNLKKVAQKLTAQFRPKELQTIHIGCATWHNLDIMCLRQSSYGLIVDFNPKNSEFIKKTVDLIKVSESREIFKQKMIEYLNSLKGEEKNLFFHRDQKGLPTERIEKELTREGSWLQNEENYFFIKSLVTDDRLVAITEDITNCQTFLSIREYLNENNVSVDTVYLSNISNFMQSDSDRKLFAKSVKSLLADETILINCPKFVVPNQKSIILHQQSLLGKNVLANTFDTKKLFEEEAETT